MESAPDRQTDQRLLEAVQAFVADHPSTDVRRFQDGIAKWGDDWTDVTPRYLRAVDTFNETLAFTTSETHELLSLSNAEKASRKWEQSYTKSDNLVDDDMLSGYGFAEVIGKHGPFVSTRVRCGIGVWGANIDYPVHRHNAEEVYVLLAGSAEFQLDDGESAHVAMRHTGDAVYVPSMLSHGFRTRDEPLVVLYIWQAGNLREKSTFS